MSIPVYVSGATVVYDSVTETVHPAYANVEPKTGSYNVTVSEDNNTFFIFNLTGSATLLLSATPPPSGWSIYVACIGVNASLLVNPNGLLLSGLTNTTLISGAGTYIFSDGSNYFLGGGSVGVGTIGTIGVYATPNVISSDLLLTDNGTTLDYTGTGGIVTPKLTVSGVLITGTPTAGQVLTATNGTAAVWATPSGGDAIGASMANQTSTQAYNQSTWNQWVADDLLFNTGMTYALSTGKFTVPTTGLYTLTATVTLNPGYAVNGYIAASFCVNGASAPQYGYVSQNVSLNNAPPLSLSTVVSLNAGDYVQLFIYNGTNTSISQLPQAGAMNAFSIAN